MNKENYIKLDVLFNEKIISINQKNNSVIETFYSLYIDDKKAINISENSKLNSIIFIKLI